ncbi:MAG: HemK2/MTQ2 family protein methyltransferase [Sporichthyaceae bacterium]
MLLLRLPGVYEPEADTHLLLDTVLAEGVPDHAHALDIGTGTGRIALALKAAGAAHVQAVDVSRRAVLSARINARLHRLPLRVRRSDVLGHVEERFDLIVANPPYVPSGGPMPRRGRSRTWHGGADGRAVLDRVCRDAPRLLKPNGVCWLVHSGLCGPQRTLDLLEQAGLEAEIVRKERIPFGPVLRAHAEWLRDQGLLGPEETTEELVVVRAVRRG